MKVTPTTLFLLGALVVIVIVAGAMFLRAPAIKKIFERFANPSQLKVMTTVCPDGFTMYMYDNVAYCCNGTVNTDATSLNKTCNPPVTAMENSFCTLGPDTPDVQHCSSLASALLAAHSSVCPASKPNFCSKNRCCASLVSSDGSDCTDLTAGTYCDVLDASKLFKNVNDCNYQSMKERDTCPANFSMSDISVPKTELTIYGCTSPNLSNTCYTQPVVDALTRLGQNTSQLTLCSNMTSSGCPVTAAASESKPTGFLKYNDQRCMVNGVKVGTQNGKKREYTEGECKIVGGLYDRGTCISPALFEMLPKTPNGTKLWDYNYQYNYACSDDPSVNTTDPAQAATVEDGRMR